MVKKIPKYIYVWFTLLLENFLDILQDPTIMEERDRKNNVERI